MDMSFDLSLPVFAAGVRDILGLEALNDGCFLRDATGRITFVHNNALPIAAVQQLGFRLQAELGSYVDPDRGFVVRADELGQPNACAEAPRFWIRLPDEDRSRHLGIVDRRIIGQDWSHAPSKGWMHGEPARLVFWSLKGGVGRSTALAVVATHLAYHERRVLAIDLDLESPGLGATLLKARQLPKFGSLDWFVETGINGAEDLHLDTFIGQVELPEAQGQFHVMPAVGSLTAQHPYNFVPKLGRAYLENVQISGGPETFLQRTRHLVDWAAATGNFDVVMVDARAGLNESTAAALLGLGADVFLFGLNTPQTFDGYKYFLSTLAVFPPGSEDNDWRLRLKMVHAKASASVSSRSSFRDRSFDIFQSTLYEEQFEASAQSLFNFNVDDPDGPHSPLIVLDDERFREFAPVAEPDRLTAELTRATFGDLVAGIMQRLMP